jgi:hypothetical protein
MERLLIIVYETVANGVDNGSWGDPDYRQTIRRQELDSFARILKWRYRRRRHRLDDVF